MFDKILSSGMFWYWNATPCPDGINRQLDWFLSQGVCSLYIHPMPQEFRAGDFYQGMEIEYLGPQYFELVAYTCQEMRKRGMYLWLYDEGGWPSGSACGKVVKTDKSFGIWTLEFCEGEVCPRQHWPDCLYPDLMNPQATQCFIETTHQQYRKWVGQEFGRTIVGIFTDEPRLLGRIGTQSIPWSPFVGEQFKKDHGRSLESVLEHLFVREHGSDSLIARRAYISTINRLIKNNYYAPISRWCDDNNLLFEGHLSGESDFSKHGFYFGDYMQQAKYFHIPGIDAINRQIFPGVNSGNYALLAASVKWLEGKAAACSESGAIYGAGLTLSDMKWIAAFQIVRGIDKISFMPALYDTQGPRRISVCSDFSHVNPQMKDLHLLESFIKQASQFCAGKKPIVHVGLFYRTEAVNDDNLAAQYDESHELLCSTILDQHTGLVMLGLEHLEKARTNNGELTVGSFALSVLIVHPASELLPEEYALFSKLLSEGIRIIFVGNQQKWREFQAGVNTERPNRLIQWASDAGQIKINCESVIEFLDRPKGLRVFVWEDGGEYGLFFFNENSFETKISFKMPHLASDSVFSEVLLENAVYNDFYPLGVDGEKYELHFYPFEVRAFYTQKSAALYRKQPKCEHIAITWQWHVIEKEAFIINPQNESQSSGKSVLLNNLTDYSLLKPEFSGTLCYNTTFKWNSQGYKKVFLNIGQVYYNAHVYVNGIDCGIRVWQPFIFDLTNAVRIGENSLDIYVTNTLANQWASPLIRSEDFCKHNNSYLQMTCGFIDQSCHSGLCGPVSILVCN